MGGGVVAVGWLFVSGMVGACRHICRKSDDMATGASTQGVIYDLDRLDDDNAAVPKLTRSSGRVAQQPSLSGSVSCSTLAGVGCGAAWLVGSRS
jgi:hypothetical protein